MKLLTRLCPVVGLDRKAVLEYIVDEEPHGLLLLLKKYYDENVQFGLDAEIMKRIYNFIADYKLIENHRVDPKYAHVVMLLLWYSRRTIFRHQDPHGVVRFCGDPQRKFSVFCMFFENVEILAHFELEMLVGC